MCVHILNCFNGLHGRAVFLFRKGPSIEIKLLQALCKMSDISSRVKYSFAVAQIPIQNFTKISPRKAEFLHADRRNKLKITLRNVLRKLLKCLTYTGVPPYR
jgi:hypothetical protein